MSNDHERTGKPGISRGMIGAVLAAGAILAGSIFTLQAVAGSRTYQHITTEAGYQLNFHRAGYKRFSQLTDEEIETRVNRVVRHIAIEIDATDEQQRKIVALVTAVAREMRPIRDNIVANRKQMHDLLLAEKIDRDAMEKMRAERIAEIDQLSKNVVTAVADVAEVLTVEQRRTLEERIREFRDMFGHHGRRGRPGRSGRWHD